MGEKEQREEEEEETRRGKKAHAGKAPEDEDAARRGGGGNADAIYAPYITKTRSPPRMRISHVWRSDSPTPFSLRSVRVKFPQRPENTRKAPLTFAGMRELLLSFPAESEREG